MWRIALVLIVAVRIHALFALELYTNSWAVRIPDGSAEAERIARKFGFINLGEVVLGSDFYHLVHRSIQRKSFSPHWGRHVQLKKEPKISWFEQQTLKRRKKRQTYPEPTDPMFRKQWYLNKHGNPDLGVLTAWSHGYTGRGVVVTIVDDGLEKDHPDLAQNYDPMASYDFNSNDPDPQPRYDPSNENHHGTRCAGEVAAIANNGICGTGIAYNAAIGGVRMLDGLITDIIEAQSLSLNPQHIDIYSASWGPEDDGKIVDGPGVLASEAFVKGIANGRGGLGSVFVWASGNGGLHYDNCNADGYSNSIYTISVGSTSENGKVPWYSEACSALLTTTYSSGINNEGKIVSTDIRHKCTDQSTGTSASAPLATGILALALEANPALTWRDLQHIVVRSSNPTHLTAEDWVSNGVGRKVSHHYGYGLLNAGQVVELAKMWETTRPQRKCVIEVVNTPQKLDSDLLVTVNVTACRGSPNHIVSLEHVQAQISLSYSRRGDLEISLTSPMGTRSVLMALRAYDTSTDGYKDWSFMTTHTWDENPEGIWTLELLNKGGYRNHGFLNNFKLILYGTEEDMMARRIQRSVRRDCLTWDSNGLCTKCESPYYIFGKLCLSYCPPKHFKTTQMVETEGSDGFTLICAACHPSCNTCNGKSDNNCTSCSPLSTYNAKNHSCSQAQSPSTDLSTTPSTLAPKTIAMAVVISLAFVASIAKLFFICWLLRRRTVNKAQSSDVEKGKLCAPNDEVEAEQGAESQLLQPSYSDED
ncbi:proprotein convertase subtilisin/kexin type 4-like [Spea bombifrons]|uniref:proprotein convertase subtilisin/kexin type 4-like n=1 Tax=Spea bombifrons TaxID=233779 RepID=UPI00234B3579|nr:proprotein convertase subtilisin/kexin type 4-like [Spea bombifrons]